MPAMMVNVLDIPRSDNSYPAYGDCLSAISRGDEAAFGE
jgi:hypothetical protein